MEGGAAVTTIKTISQIECVLLIVDTVINKFSTFITIRNGIRCLSYDLQNENPLSYYRYQLFYNQNRVDNPQQFLQEISHEKIVEVQRWGESLDPILGFIPSGVFTPFTIIFANKACRHEFILLFTENYAISIEVSADNDCRHKQCLQKRQQKDIPGDEKCPQCRKKKTDNAKKDSVLTVHVWDIPDELEKGKIVKKYKDRFCSRIMKSFKGKKLKNNLKLENILCLIRLQAQIYDSISQDQEQSNFWKKKAYDLFSSNCKTFSRAILYFCKKKKGSNEVVDSILGNFTDKPLMLFDPINALIQQGVIASSKLISTRIDETYRILNESVNQFFPLDNGQQMMEQDNQA